MEKDQAKTTITVNRLIHINIAIIMSLCFIVIAGCSIFSPEKDPTADQFIGREMWTTTNLHLFSEQYIYWQNYLTGRIFPLGTTIRFSEINIKSATFVDNYNKSYVFYWRGPHKDYEDVFAKEFRKYFAFEDPVVKLKDLPGDIWKSIELGEVKLGMNKEEVLMSWGWPPGMKNPRTKDIWIYWISDWERRAVRFEKDRVAEIIYTN